MSQVWAVALIPTLELHQQAMSLVVPAYGQVRT